MNYVIRAMLDLYSQLSDCRRVDLDEIQVVNRVERNQPTLGLKTSQVYDQVRTWSQTYLTENSLARQQFGSQANDKAKHC